MTGGVMAAVLLAALLHAGWNALIKAGGDHELDTALIHALGCGFGVALLATVGLPPPAAWPYAAASIAIHVAYYIALVGAYRHGDLGFAYPIMRGSAPLLVALASAPLLGEALSPLAWAGVIAVCGGVLLIGLARARVGAVPGAQRRALAFALANAAIIAVYTVVDGAGVRVAGDAWAYVGLLFALDGLPFFALVLWKRRARWPETRRYLTARTPVALVGSAASMGAYGIALWAMTRAPIATVAALRETSVLFAAAIGVLLLKEPFRLQRVVGTAAVVAGVVALRLG
jgi:phosphonate utilization associated putative membrane protein